MLISLVVILVSVKFDILKYLRKLVLLVPMSAVQIVSNTTDLHHIYITNHGKECP